MGALSPRWLNRPQDALDRRRRQFEGSAAGAVWKRLSALDLFGQAMGLAALLLLTLFPFLIVLSALSDRNVATTLSSRIGLNPQAAQAMSHLFNRSGTTSSTVTAGGMVALIAGVVGVAGAIQGLYERIFGLPRRGMRDVHRFLAWIALTVGLVAGASFVGRILRNRGAGSVLLAIVSFVVLTAFFWWSMHFLMAGRIAWRRLLPCAVATSTFWIGLGVFSSFYFSREVISNDRTYGTIGIVFALLSWLVAVSVVMILGPVIGIAWDDARTATRRRKHQDDSNPAMDRATVQARRNDHG